MSLEVATLLVQYMLIPLRKVALNSSAEAARPLKRRQRKVGLW